ncbi:MAG: hypothetical protein ASARMPREDX12_002139 [Alectoria sarmentosa]|nr:MAG: hypothetical protein ASARMPREDX12_002139 [Alectoria sarmentosa]
MSCNGSAQASETPFNMADYVNFDFEAPRQSIVVASETSMAESVQRISVDNTYTGAVDEVDTDFTELFQLPDGSNALGNGVTATPAPLEGCGNPNTSEAPIAAVASLDSFPAFKQMSEDFVYSDAFGTPTDNDARFGDVITISPVSEDLGMTNAFQKIVETDVLLDNFAVSRPTAVTRVIDPAASKIPRSPSRWVPNFMQAKTIPQSPASSQVIREPLRFAPLTTEPSRWVLASPELQQHLNMVYAKEIISYYGSPDPTPVLYVPVKQQYDSPLSEDSISPKTVPPQHKSSQTSRLRPEILQIDPSLLQRNETLPSQQQLSNGMSSPTSPIADEEAQKIEDPASAPIKKRVLDANLSDSEPAPKRNKTAQAGPELTVAKDDDSDDDDEPVTTRTRTARPAPQPTIAKDEESKGEADDGSVNDAEDETYDSDASGLSSAPPSPVPPPTPVKQKSSSTLPPRHSVLKKVRNLRYEQQQESRRRDQPKKTLNNRRMNQPVITAKWQRLLEEIQDTEGFAEAQDHKIEGSVERDFVPSRPVRKGARKNYVGQE